jgi:hypothetical protein
MRWESGSSVGRVEGTWNRDSVTGGAEEYDDPGLNRDRRLLVVVSDLVYSSTLTTEAEFSTETSGSLRNTELYNANFL